jgi:hypothetical protein
MPPVRTILTADNLIQFTDFKGIQRTLLAASIPVGNNTPSKVETFINTIWIPANVTDYQMRVHVFSIAPLRVALGTWNMNETIPPNWWEDT